MVLWLLGYGPTARDRSAQGPSHDPGELPTRCPLLRYRTVLSARRCPVLRYRMVKGSRDVNRVWCCRLPDVRYCDSALYRKYPESE
eukprot:1173788-Rhodomonas_salina.6